MGSWRQLEQLEENELEVQLSGGLTDLYPSEKSSTPSSVGKDKMKSENNCINGWRYVICVTFLA